MGKRAPYYIIAGIVVLGILLMRLGGRSSTSTPAGPVDPLSLPGIMTGAEPWPPEITHLSDRLAATGLPALSEEGTALHIHEHLDLFVNGGSVAVPAGIGIDEAAGFISPIHTHDATGIIHVESPVVRSFTLGQFFDVWGLRFTAQCLGGYCADGAHALSVYSNGAPVQGDPRLLALSPHQEIAIIYGSASSTTLKIPASYDFAPGL